MCTFVYVCMYAWINAMCAFILCVYAVRVFYAWLCVRMGRMRAHTCMHPCVRLVSCVVACVHPCMSCDVMTRDDMYVCNLCMECMYVIMYICIYACMYICIVVYVCMYVCMYACVHVCMYVCVYVCIVCNVCNAFLCMRVCMYLRICNELYVCDVCNARVSCVCAHALCVCMTFAYVV